MEPTSVLTGINSVLKAAEGIAKLKTDADKLAPEDARYYATYLDIASQAIKGLEQEYIEILVEAAHCDIDDLEQKRHLLTRIDTYITREILRPELGGAIEHLRAGREALLRNAERLLIWPKVKKDRSEALQEFDRLVDELSGYLGLLGDYDQASAKGLHDLYAIKKAAAAGKEQFTQLVDNLLMSLNKSSLMYFTGECARVIEVLRIAFR